MQMTLKNVKALLDDLQNMGIKCVELTGGEISTHPDICEIIDYISCNTKIEQIALLTNGFLISEKLMNTIISNKNKIIIQLDLHSLNDEYFTWFTNTPNSLGKVKENIKYLQSQNVKTRVATIVTQNNLNELENIADWVYNVGIKSFGVSLVTPIGRALENNDLLLSDIEEFKLFEEKINKINTKYNHFLNLIEFPISHGNCGCVTSHCVISADGNIKICSMDDRKHVKMNLGNVFNENIKEIYNKNIDFLNIFLQTSGADISYEYCRNCKHINFCNNCIYRTLLQASELKEQCGWYVKNLPDSLKKSLLNF